jgi:uncharacterized protein (DUF433 family)
MTTSGRLATTIGIERALKRNWSAKLASGRCRDRDWNEPMQNRRERISVSPAVCHGRACVRGTRVLVSAILDNVAAGISREEVLLNCAALTDPDIDGALAYAAELTREGTVDLPLEIKT